MSKGDHLLVRAARGEPVERPPVWAMRQAGRWDPEFHRLRAGVPFYEFSRNVELAAQASLLPRRFGVDGIILFYDITTLPVAMGLPFELKRDIGPTPDSPIRTLQDLDRLCAEPPPAHFQHIRDLLGRVKEQLEGELPIIVFAGAPYTVASYCIGTGKDTQATLRFVGENPEVWHGLLDKLTTATVGFLRTLIHDGADLYQLFDSWAGTLGPEDYDRWAQPFHETVIRTAVGVPRILFVKECPHLERMARSGADVVSLGTRHNLAAARKQYPELVFQGNVDQQILRRGKAEDVVRATKVCVMHGGCRRHVVNLNHGVDPATPVENFEAFIQTVRGP